MKILGPKNQFRKINGFWKFAFLPTILTNGDSVFFDWYWIPGEKFGCQNRYSVKHKRFELKYSKESARL
jgi:hypothetical protein